jgi:Flp pilus assembly protein TadD
VLAPPPASAPAPESAAPAAAAPRGLTAAHGALLVALVAAAASWNVLLNGFAWDDSHNILLNRWVREPGRVWEAFLHHLAAFDPRFDSSFYRPVMHLVFAATYAVAGLRPWAFHLVNLLAHAAMSACVYLVLARWAARPAAPEPRGPGAARPGWESLASGPLVAALLFAVHPIHAQAVAWNAGIVDVSYSLLFVVAFLCATHEGPGRLVPLALAPAAFFLSLLSKEPAVMLLPVVAIAFALRGALTDGARRREAVVRLSALCVPVAAYLVLRVNALGGLMRSGGQTVRVGLEDGVATALALFAGYLRLLIAPFPLSALHEHALVPGLLHPRALAALAVVAGFAALVWALRRHASALLGAALLVLPLLPALYVPVLGDSAGAERYAYLPSAGAALLLAAALDVARERGRAARLAIAAAAAAALVAATSATLAHNAVWRDDVTLWSDTVAKAPSSAAAHESLGVALLSSRRAAPAVAAFERAVALDPMSREARVNLASALLTVGRTDEALAAAQDGVRALPNVAEAHAILGSVLTAKGRFAEAVAALERAIALNPSHAPVRNAAAIAYSRLGRSDQAVAHLREAIRLQPENAVYAQNLALLLRR